MADNIIEVRIVGTKEVLEMIRRKSGQVRSRVKDAMLRITFGLQSHIRREKLSGQVLHRRSGQLSGAVFPEVLQQGSQIVGKVFVRPNAWYGKLHEYGMVSAAHTRTMNHLFGKPVAAFQVKVKAFKFPERSFMRSSLDDFRRRGIPKRLLGNAIREALA